MFLVGIMLSSYSCMFIIIYLNLLKMGYTFIGYTKYISSKIECLLLIPGIILLIVSLRNIKYIFK